MPDYPQVILKSRGSRHFSGHHPWIMAHSIIEPTVAPSAGQIVDLVRPNGHWIGRGIYNPHSRIRIRLYHWDPQQDLDESWLRSKLDNARQLRQKWMDLRGEQQALRWVNSEGDGLSGLIIDQFGDYVVIQINALAMQAWLPMIQAWLLDQQLCNNILLRIDSKTASNEGLLPQAPLLHGCLPSAPVTITENNTKLHLDLSGGQKTGYYLDQRENRIRAASWMSPGPMLDVCCYQGGFSLAACQTGKPTRIVAVDSSQPALDLAQQNASTNGVANIQFVQADCFDYLEQLVQQKQRFQTIVLDPPRMASHRQKVSMALRAYHRLNLSAIDLLAPGGMLVTCSCSGRVSRSDLIGVLASVANKRCRQVRVLESLGADVDHPINVNCPESEYLKCLVCQVD